MVAMATREEFCDRLKRAREKHHPRVTQVAIAERLGIPLRTYQNWEQGHAEPPEYIQALILKAVKEYR